MYTELKTEILFLKRTEKNICKFIYKTEKAFKIYMYKNIAHFIILLKGKKMPL